MRRQRRFSARSCALGLVLALAAAGPAAAAERRLLLSSFERVRVDGPIRVTVTAGGSPGGRVTGDAALLDAIEVRQDGTTVTIRPAQSVPQSGAGDAAPIVVTLATPRLSAATLIGAGALDIAGMRGDRVDLSIAGAGSISAAVDAGDLNATLIGGGRLAASGRAARGRIVVNGSGQVDAAALDAGELTVRLDGPGAVTGHARYVANVTSTGLGHVTIDGPARCVMKTVTVGTVKCGPVRRN